MSSNNYTRLAVIDENKCRPNVCKQECKKSCPVVRMGKLCIEINERNKAQVSEGLCNGCGICVKKCPFKAVSIINLPKEMDAETVHRYSQNSFKLHRLPTLRPGTVLGLLGGNGIGKSTALKILSGKLKPNLGQFGTNEPPWEMIIKHFRGSSLHNYFIQIVENKIVAVFKPQNVYMLPKVAKGKVIDLLNSKDQRNVKARAIAALELEELLDRDIEHLSGGELQRVSIAATYVRDATVYMFDEPSSFLDIHQRLNAAKLIKSIVEEDPSKYAVVVEHDLSILEFLSDYVCLLYGKPAAYGVITFPSGVSGGINNFLAGSVPSENLRFRDTELTFRQRMEDDEDSKGRALCRYSYPDMHLTLGNFHLQVEAGEFTDSQIVVLLGRNGTGKTSFIRLLAGKISPDNKEAELPNLSVSYKPQEVLFKSSKTVRQLLQTHIHSSFFDPLFISDVVKPMELDDILDQEVTTLSGGETQRVALVLCLGTPADIYLIDEPSACLDAEQRLLAAKIIKRFIMHSKRTAFIVEHDFTMAVYLADTVIVYDGAPSVKCVAHTPQPLVTGMNLFLKNVGVTFRQDKRNYRPRINKLNSVSDREQVPLFLLLM